VRSEIDNHGAREERLTREAAYSKRYREKNKEDQFNSLEKIHITHEQSTLTQQPSTSDAAQLQLQELRARQAEYNRRYRAKKKEERHLREYHLLFLQSIIGGEKIKIKRRYHVKHLYYRR
jgi:hypothetical protein